MFHVKHLIIVSVLFVVSCDLFKPQEINQTLSPHIIYRRDMEITVNDVLYDGVAVVPKADEYTFHVKSAGKLDLFTLTNCHREWIKERPENPKKRVRSGLFGWGWKTLIYERETNFTYVPIAEIETSEYCPIDLGGYDKENGRHSWGFIDFEDDTHTIQAVQQCNGEIIKRNGVSACQSRSGKWQTIEFDKEVIMSPDLDCFFGDNQGTYFEWQTKPGVCVYLFQNIETGEKHKLTTIGYESILIRK